MASLQSLENWLYMSYFLAAKAVPMVAVGSSLIFAFSPMHTMRTIQRSRSTLQYSFAPFFFFFVQSLIYTLYAYVTANVLMGSSSALSTILGLHYVYVFCKHAQDRATPVRYVAVSLSLVTLLGVHALAKPLEESQLLIGVPGNVLSLLTSASPLLQVKKIVRTGDASCLPFGMSVMTVVAGGLWLLYGLILADPLIIYPNAFALTMGLIQVGLILRYNSKKVAVATAKAPASPKASPAASSVDVMKKVVTTRKAVQEKEKV